MKSGKRGWGRKVGDPSRAARNFVLVYTSFRKMSTLGKRKAQTQPEQDATPTDAAHTNGSTLFISNLPYTATSTDLQTLFSDLAPVRTAFVATTPGSGVSKGVGYVSFAAREDATSAFEYVQKEGLQMNGRSVRVGWADIKVCFLSRNHTGHS